MKIGWRTFLVISLLVIIFGGIAIVYLLDPSAFSPGSGIQTSNGPTINQKKGNSTSGANNVSPIIIRSTLTASYCNCTDTQTDDG